MRFKKGKNFQERLILKIDHINKSLSFLFVLLNLLLFVLLLLSNVAESVLSRLDSHPPFDGSKTSTKKNWRTY